ncbi:MAG: hypothetical protein HUU50_16745 [Candidatus Brocadiae bacterium]|nr:hypothetical protein [Candidatus Brocadiia bacterium]
MAGHNPKAKIDKTTVASTTKNAISFAALTESTEQGIIFRKPILQGQGKIALYAKKYTCCQRLEIELNGIAWQFKYKKQRLMVRKQEKGQMFLMTLPEGIVYWETELGYFASFWQKSYLKKVEIGNYIQGYIECILCEKSDFQGPYKLEKESKIVKPFARFLLSIKPFGCAMV